MNGLGQIRRLLGYRDFRFLWFAQSTSVIGDNIVVVALALFVIGRTGSATDLGLVLAAASLPLVAFVLVGGVWADRLPRQRVMIATDLVRFTLHALLAGLIFSGAVQIWQVVIIEMLFGSAEAFFRPASNGLLPQTVPEAELRTARTKLRAQLVRNLKTVSGKANQLGFFDTVLGDYRAMFGLEAAWEKVGAEDVKRVAAGYLQPAKRTVVVLEPIPSGRPVKAEPPRSGGVS